MSSRSSGNPPTKKKPWGKRPVVEVTPSFKGTISEIATKIFVTGHQQASKYDEAYKGLLPYTNEQFDHMVHLALEHKDAAAGMALLTSPLRPRRQ